MRIRNPPKFIMSISFIMSLIMTLLVFQCVFFASSFYDTLRYAKHKSRRITFAAPLTATIIMVVPASMADI